MWCEEGEKKDREVGEEWMMNERIILLVRALLSAGRRCSSRTPSVSQSVSQPLICDAWACASVCARQTRRGSFIKRRVEWKNIEGKLTRNCFSFTRGRESHRRCAWEKVVCMGEGRQKKMGGEKRVCNCRAAVLSGGGCHLESGWLSSGH